MIQREQFAEIKAHLHKKEITFLMGARQVGKTTLMQLLRAQIKDRQTLWLNLDLESDFARLDSQASFLAYADLELGKKGGVVFIDEIQRKENAGKFLKGIFDAHPQYKFVISGSGSLELKEKLFESLAGRKRMFEISGISFFEFVHFKTEYKYTDRLTDWFEINSDLSRLLLLEFLRFGGYPAVVLAETASEKRLVLQEILQSYLLRDISTFIGSAKLSNYGHLLKLMALHAAQPVKYSALSQYVNVSAPTVKDYLWYMEHTYFVTKSSPHFTNALKEIVKEPTYYFNDLGILANQRNQNREEEVSMLGLVFQNFVFNELKRLFRNESVQFKYWRTKDQAEVDIVLELGTLLIPIEVKMSVLKPGFVTKALASFVEIYGPKKAYFVHLGTQSAHKLGDTELIQLPFWNLGAIAENMDE